MLVLSFAFTLMTFALGVQAQVDIQGLQGREEQEGCESESSVDAFEDLLTEYSLLRSHRVAINSKDPNELSRLFFLSHQQLDALWEYLVTYGPMLTLFELGTIRGIDRGTLQKLLPVVCLDDTAFLPSVKKRMEANPQRAGLSITASRILETQQEYLPSVNDSGQLVRPAFAGNPWHLRLKANIEKKEVYRLMLSGEKDPGEGLFNGFQRNGFDFVSGSLCLFGPGKVKRIILGDYQLGIGQGLNIWGGLVAGTNSEAAQFIRMPRGLVQVSRGSEGNFFRGIALEVKAGPLRCLPFFSRIALDGRSSADSSGAFSLVEGGFHRDSTEAARKARVRETTAGLQMRFQYHGLESGALLYYHGYSEPIERNEDTYAAFSALPQYICFTGIDFRLRLKKSWIYGEMQRPTGIPGAETSWIFGMESRVTPSVLAALQGWHYAKGPVSPFSNAPGSTSPNANESSLRLALTFQEKFSLKYSLFFQYSRYPWIKYTVDAPSFRCQYGAVLSYECNEKARTSFMFTHRCWQESRAGDLSNNKAIHDKEQLKFSLGASYDDLLCWDTRIAMVFNRNDDLSWKTGLMLSEQLACSFLKDRIRLTAGLYHFMTASYDERIYYYAGGYGSNSYMASLSGRGYRYQLSIRTKLMHPFVLGLTYSRICYTDRLSLGSLPSSHKSEISFAASFQ